MAPKAWHDTAVVCSLVGPIRRFRIAHICLSIVRLMHAATNEFVAGDERPRYALSVCYEPSDSVGKIRTNPGAAPKTDDGSRQVAQAAGVCYLRPSTWVTGSAAKALPRPGSGLHAGEAFGTKPMPPKRVVC